MENALLGGLSVFVDGGEGLAHVFRLEDFASDISAFYLQARLPLLAPLLGSLFEFGKSFLAVAGLGPSGTGHAPHPVQFGAVEVVGPGYLGIGGGDALRTLVEVILVVSGVGVESLFVEFENRLAHVVQEVSVVGDHE